MFKITEPFAGIFMVEGGTTENSIGLEVRGCYCCWAGFSFSPLEELLPLDFELSR